MANLVAMDTNKKLAEVTDAIGATMPAPASAPKLTPRLDALETLTAGVVTFLASLTASVTSLLSFANRFRSVRVTGTNLVVGAVADVVVTFPSGFADTSYTVTHTIEQPGLLTGILTSSSIVAKTATSVTVRVKNIGVLTGTPTIHVIAIHD